ncbi:hypothetical protein [Aquibacillus sediminis]|uniref:hypothetical protein n=1 Tax=Aquibacillus sediminis TaxID=2574734 RepID=UPI001108CD0F|nr:hypothetical protein [Aquibacillus sediminis]
MTEERKRTIINEIKYWKQHNLLPSHYCDFLLALYSEGQDILNDDNVSPNNWSIRYTIILFADLLMLLLTFFVIYFTQLATVMQIVFIVILTTISYFLFWYWKKENTKLLHYLMIIFLFHIFLDSVFISGLVSSMTWVFYAVFLLNCLVWVMIGRLKKVIFLTISGIIGIILLLVIIFI